MQRTPVSPIEPELGLGASVTAPMMVATDGHFDSDAAVRLGRVLAGTANALHIVTVVRDRPAAADLPPAIAEDLDAARRAESRARAVSQVQRTLAEWSDLELLEGDPATSIAQAARASGAKLIVCGLGRRSRGPRLFDETALRLIRLAGLPVYAVSVDSENAPSRIVAAIDFSETSIRAARLAIEVAAPEATIYLIHIVSRHAAALGGGVAGTPGGEGVEAALKQVRMQLRIPAGMVVHAVVLRGQPADELLMFADVVNADLVATGTHGRGFVGRALAGSVATRVLRGASCSVLTVSPLAALADTTERDAPSYAAEHAEWVPELDAFSQRNAGRYATLEVDDPAVDPEAVAAGWPFLGAAFDPRDQCVELMFGDDQVPGRHLMHAVTGVTSIVVPRDDRGADLSLSVAHGAGCTRLTFTPGR